MFGFVRKYDDLTQYQKAVPLPYELAYLTSKDGVTILKMS